MNRKKFLKTGCIACTSIGMLSTLIESCTPVKYTTGQLNNNGILIDLKSFVATNHEYRSYVIVRHETLKYPICVYRTQEGAYTALLLQCSHQGAELQVAGEQLTCPAHGSEFDKQGNVTQGPAVNSLRKFPVNIVKEQLFIDLRK